MPLVFQYGSNVSTARLNSPVRLDGRARLIGPALTAEAHELAFTVWSEQNGCAAADLIPGRGRRIWGALYEIPEAAVYRRACPPGGTCLDAIEAEGRNYVRTAIQACDPDRRPLPAPVLTYLGRNRRAGIRTAEDYTAHILGGLREHGAPGDYLEYVRRRIALNLSGGSDLALSGGADLRS